MKKQYNKICRLCGNTGKQLIPIFEDDGLLYNLSSKIKKHLFCIDVSQNDNLPQKICYQCISTLVIWSDLFQLSAQVDKNLKSSSLKKSKKSDVVISSNTLDISTEDDALRDEIEKDLFDDNIATEMFKEIQEFDHFLRQSPSRPVSEDSDAESIAGSIRKNMNHESPNNPPGQSSRPNTLEKCKILSKPQKTIDNSIAQFSETAHPIETNFIIVNDVTTIHNEDTLNEENPPLNAAPNESTNSSNGSVAPKKKRSRSKLPSLDNLTSRVCHICGKFFKGPDTMRIHVKTVHSAERPHICHLCDTAFKRKDHLDCHVKYKHECNSYPKRPRKENTKTQQRLCVHCGKILSSTHLLKEHMNSYHSENQPYKCEQCNISFSRYSTLYHHSVTRNHKNSSFSKTCDLCGLDFQSESFYFRHRWKHPEIVYCEICDTTFEDNESFKKHVQSVHESEKSFQCDTCGKKFGTKISLKIHLRVHSGIKPYECQYCSWRFHKKGQLAVHIYRHTGERPYVCDICGRGFKQKGDMRKHKVGHVKHMKKNME